MDRRDLAFLESYLEEAGCFSGVVRLNPAQALWDGSWLEIRAVRPGKGSVTLELAGGKRLRLASARRQSTVRDLVRGQIVGLLKARLTGYRIERVLAATDRVRRQPASILRVLLSRGRRRVAALAAYPGSSPETFDRLLSSLALWWEQLSLAGRGIEALLLIPEEWSERLIHCLPLIDIPVVCCKYGLDSPGSEPRVRQIYPAPPGSTSVGWPYVLFPRPEATPEPLLDLKERHRDLDLTLRHGRWELSFRGLAVAWQPQDGLGCLFDSLRPTALNEASKPRFELHLSKVRRFRRFPSPDSGHPFYHWKPERWLESVVLRNHRLIDSEFAENVYSQVPTCIDGQRKVLDLLTVTRSGRLAVLELKVEKDLGLIFQALDYWERVETHLRRGDFERGGYFGGMTLSPESPLLYLVSPLFEFHRVMPVLRARLRRRVRFRCVGVNADWRRELKTLRRFEF